MIENDKERIHLRITGRVQGVGFRWFVLSEARRLGIPGWVRNNPDGSVELEAEGSGPEVAALRARVAKGPPASRVDHLQDLPISDEDLPQRFQTRR